jgi:endonuclease G
MKKVLFILLLITSLTFCASQDNYIPPSGHFLFQVENYYSGCYDAIHHGPHKIWYTLTRDQVNEDAKPKRVGFTTNKDDGLLSAEMTLNGYKMPTTSDYTNSGYERGHMAPAEDFDHSQDAYSSTFFMANVWPQDSDVNNPGAWYVLEKYVRELALEYGTVEIEIEVTEFSNITFGRADRLIYVPLSFKKIIKYNNVIETYIVPNESGTARNLTDVKRLYKVN